MRSWKWHGKVVSMMAYGPEVLGSIPRIAKVHNLKKSLSEKLIFQKYKIFCKFFFHKYKSSSQMVKNSLVAEWCSFPTSSEYLT